MHQTEAGMAENRMDALIMQKIFIGSKDDPL